MLHIKKNCVEGPAYLTKFYASFLLVNSQLINIKYCTGRRDALALGRQRQFMQSITYILLDYGTNKIYFHFYFDPCKDTKDMYYFSCFFLDLINGVKYFKFS